MFWWEREREKKRYPKSGIWSLSTAVIKQDQPTNNFSHFTSLTIYDVANNEQIDAIKIGGIAIGSPGKNAKISVVANAVRVIATFIAAAVHKTTICNGTVSGKTKYNNRPNAAPEHIKGKMYPVKK